ncbi:MAG: hypothetical protein PHW69_02225 [Elusimicrobiaceae bacterium]|nr:hypothetical protein [Elusimicrobiaceae bacterium]
MKRFALIPLVFLFSGAVFAQGEVSVGRDYAVRAADCIKGLEALDPDYAVECSRDRAFLDFVKSRRPGLEAWLVSRSRAIKDMTAVVDGLVLKVSTPALSEALEARLTSKPYIDMGAPGHEGIGFGPEPEQTLRWLDRYRADLPAWRREKVAVALRNYDALSRIETGARDLAGAVTVSSYVDDYARKSLANTPGYDSDSVRWWRSLDLKARSALLAGIAREQMVKLAEYGSSYDYDRFRAHWGWGFLRREDLPLMQNYLRNFKRSAALRDKIAMTYEDSQVSRMLAKIAKMPAARREQYLDRLFDGKSGDNKDFDDLVRAAESAAGRSADSRGVTTTDFSDAALTNAAISQNVERSVSPEQNDAIVSALNARMAGELGGTAAGGKVLAFYRDNPLNVRMEQGNGYYGKYEVAPEAAATGEIVLNTGLVQQYMDQRGITTAQLLADQAELDSLSKYVAPVLVHEATHQMQHSVSDGRMLDPYVQSDEAESAGAEALFTLEKMKTDREFARLMTAAQETSPYARQTLARADAMSKNPLEFRRAVAQQEYANLPDMRAASARIIAVADDELRRRDALCCGDLAELERTGLDMSVVSRISLEEFEEVAGQIRTSELERIRAEFLKGRNMYDTGASAVARQQVRAVKNLVAE